MIFGLVNIFTNLGVFALFLFLLSFAIARFLKEWLPDQHRWQLREKFEVWWLTVSELNKRKFAVAVADQISRVVDRYFGKRLFSARAFWRASIIASGLLVCSLALVGLANHRPFGVEPWYQYRQTAKYINHAAAVFKTNSMPRNSFQSRTITTFTNQVSFPTNFPPAETVKSNIIPAQTNFVPLSVTPPTNSVQIQVQQELDHLVRIVNRFDTEGWTVVYSALFFCLLIFLNSSLFYFAVTFSRLILREIIAAGRVFSAVSLITVNFVFVLVVATAFLLLLTLLATPIVWYFMPLVYKLSQESFGWLLIFFVGGGVVSWIFANSALKVITIIALLPCICTFAVTIFTAFAIAGRKLFHRMASAVLLRFAERGFLTMIVASLTLINGVIAAVSVFVHLFH